jgi:hypothetical protein
VIADYLESLRAELAFDPSLARRLCREVEDHLWEAAAADPEADGLEAQRRAVANFGEPTTIAAAFAKLSLATKLRQAGAAAVLLIGGVFISMKARVVWYAAVDCAATGDPRAVVNLVGSIDRYAFWLSAAIGIAGWVYSGGGLDADFSTSRPRFRRCLALCAAAACMLVLSVLSDGVLVVLHFLDMGLSIGLLVPVLTLAAEVGCVAVLAFRVGSVVQRAAWLGSRLHS